LVLAEDKVTNYFSHLTYFNIWRGGPPDWQTNRPIWQVPGCQAAQSAQSVT